MGVKGLTGLVEENKSVLLPPSRLRGGRLVVDAYSVVYHCFFEKGVDTCYGGDYGHFAAQLRCFFGALGQCGVAAVVIMDGACEPTGVKTPCRLGRLANELETAKRLCNGGDGPIGRLLPIHAPKVFIEVCEELNIPRFTALADCDRMVVAAANALQCPVLSSDSDFYIFDVGAGYLPLSHFDWDGVLADDGGRFIRCKMYKVGAIEECVPGLRRQLLPLFASLCGNDFVERDLFDGALERCVDGDDDTSLRADSDRHRAMLGVLRWLAQFQVLDEATAQILSFVTNDQQRRKAATALKASVEMYDCGRLAQGGGGIRSMIESELPSTIDIDCFHALPPSALMLLTERVEILRPMVEDFSQPTPFVCSADIRTAIRSLVFAGATRHVRLATWQRDVNQMIRKRTDFTVVEDVPPLNVLFGMKRNERRRLLLRLLDLEHLSAAIKALPTEQRVFALAVALWRRSKHSTVHQDHLDAVLLHAFVLLSESASLAELQRCMADVKSRRRSGWQGEHEEPPAVRFVASQRLAPPTVQPPSPRAAATRSTSTASCAPGQVVYQMAVIPPPAAATQSCNNGQQATTQHTATATRRTQPLQDSVRAVMQPLSNAPRLTPLRSASPLCKQALSGQARQAATLNTLAAPRCTQRPQDRAPVEARSVKTLHTLAQLQCVLIDLCRLNDVCGEAFCPPAIQVLFNGRPLYRLVMMLKTDRLLAIEELLQAIPVKRADFYEFANTIREMSDSPSEKVALKKNLSPPKPVGQSGRKGFVSANPYHLLSQMKSA